MKILVAVKQVAALDDDFEIPDNGNWTKERTMGQGAYGKVMECIH
jgi:hypothetical protein